MGKKTKANSFYFTRFVAVFTVIFLLMTAIILRVMEAGVYSSVDSELVRTTENINDQIERRLNTIELSSTDLSTKPINKPSNILPFRGSTIILFFNIKGELLNDLEYFGEFSDVELVKTNLETISNESIAVYDEISENKYEIYRQMTCRVDNLSYPEITYATVMINITRLQENHSRSVRVTAGVMFVFWLLSVFASLYLARWARKPIQQSYERQKEFVENASHELRTPLSVLQNRLESLFRRPDETILDNYESIAASLDEVRNMKLLTSNLLEMARRDDGLEANFEELTPAFFDDIFANYELITDENGKTFSGKNELTSTFQSDRTLLKQLLTILFDNAVKYTDEDGAINISVYQKEKKLHIAVSDNGPGIPDKDKPQIFDRFYRVDKARTRQKGGFGLGLALAKQIVIALHGKISLEDNQPKGTIFKVSLPL